MNSRYWTPGRLALGLLVIIMVGFWGWIYLGAPRENPDRFADTAFSEAAVQVCTPIQAEIDQLPPGHEAESAQSHGLVVRAGTDLTITMVAELRALLPLVTDADDLGRLNRWFEDWDAYIADREAHVTRLAEATADTPDRELAFLVSERVAGGFYTARMDGLANVNDMESCHVPKDI
jgi:hypothetical protein